MMRPEEKHLLLGIARQAIDETVNGKRAGPIRVSGALKEPCGAFVTVRVNGQLRGCIGYARSTRPLALVVGEVARKAVLDDPRFAPLTPRELPGSTVEISILSQLEPVGSPEEFQVGVHGLMIEADFQRGLLLPQVAVEMGWDKEEFLGAVTKKAGLPDGSWRRESASLFRFTAEVIAGKTVSDE